MRKYQSVFIAAILTVCVSSAFAQGTVVFNNGTGLVQQMGFGDPSLRPIPKGGGEVQLFWAASGTAYTPWVGSLTPATWYAWNPGWSLGPVVGFSTPIPGKFNGGTLTLAPLNPGSTIDYVVIAWVGNAQSFDAALAMGSPAAVSSKFMSPTGNPTTVPPGVPVPLASSFGGLIFNIPEPSSLALASIGAAALLALWRRKCSSTVNESGFEDRSEEEQRDSR
jgi:hypothetical protein